MYTPCITTTPVETWNIFITSQSSLVPFPDDALHHRGALLLQAKVAMPVFDSQVNGIVLYVLFGACLLSLAAYQQFVASDC